MDDIKDLILDKAKERFERFGFKKTTMDGISRDCKISKRTIYEHFKCKEDLFMYLIIREKRKTQAIIFTRIGESSNPLEKLIQFVKTTIAHFREDHFLTGLLKSDDDFFSSFLISKYQCMVEDEMILIIANIISEGKKQGIFRQLDENVVAYAGLKLVQAFSYMLTIEFCKEKEELSYYTDVLIDFFIHAVSHNSIRIV